MKEIAIITYSMIPHALAWGGCQRMYYLANAFLEAGYSVTVFSVANKVNQTFGNPIRFNARALPIEKKFYQSFVDSKLQQKNSGTSSGGQTSAVGKMRAAIKQNKLIFNAMDSTDKFFFNEPSFLMGPITRNWCKTHADEINQYINNQGVEAVIISGPPFGMFSIAEEIKAKNEVPVILDYRDPWNLWHKKSRYALRLEARNFQYADRVVFTNKNLEHDMQVKFPILAGKTDIIMNGYSSDAWSGIQTEETGNHQQLILTYTGSVDIVETSKFGFRDVTVFFDALEKAVNDGCNIRLVFVGAANPNTPYAEEQKKRLGDHLEISGMVSNTEAMKRMMQSDALLILHTTTDNSSKYLVGGKLYDYIRAGKFVLSIGDPEGLNSKTVAEEKIGAYCENTVEAIYSTLVEMFKKWKAGNLTPADVHIEKFSREYQNRHYVEIVEGCANG